jgi:hypothetical protein
MKTTLKIAVAVCGLVGSISYNAGDEIEYLEDSELFGKTSVQQAAGWSWGLSKALALDPPFGAGNNPDPGACHGSVSCAIDQSNGDDYAQEQYEDYLWEQYDNCIAAAQTPEQQQACEDIVAGL